MKRAIDEVFTHSQSTGIVYWKDAVDIQLQGRLPNETDWLPLNDCHGGPFEPSADGITIIMLPSCDLRFTTTSGTGAATYLGIE